MSVAVPGGIFLVIALLLSPVLRAETTVKVVTLHPLLTDLVQQVGGEQVEVVALCEPGSDPHKFEPKPRQLQAAKGAALFLASGKGLESYLGKLRGMVGEDRVLEVGEDLPEYAVANLLGDDHAHHDHDHDHEGHDHHHHDEDPHWWHSIDCWKRAARVVANALAAIDPDHADLYKANAREMRKDLDELDGWIRLELAKVPVERRTLATAHAAFGYFCGEFDWQMLAVQGLNRERVAAPAFVAKVAAVLQEQNVPVLFPEQQSNPKTLRTLAEATGVKLGPPLMAAGGESIEEMFRHNVGVLVETLGSP